MMTGATVNEMLFPSPSGELYFITQWQGFVEKAEGGFPSPYGELYFITENEQAYSLR